MADYVLVYETSVWSWSDCGVKVAVSPSILPTANNIQLCHEYNYAYNENDYNSAHLFLADCISFYILHFWPLSILVQLAPILHTCSWHSCIILCMIFALLSGLSLRLCLFPYPRSLQGLFSCIKRCTLYWICRMMQRIQNAIMSARRREIGAFPSQEVSKTDYDLTRTVSCST